MVNEKDFHYMEQALAEIKAIEGYTKGLSYGEFVEDGKTVDATMFRLQQMVEWMKKLSLGARSSGSETESSMNMRPQITRWYMKSSPMTSSTLRSYLKVR